VETDHGPIVGDAYVLALGSYSPLLARPIGVKLPIYPVKGYSLTLPITDPEAPPRISASMRQPGGLRRLGDRLRMTATADFAGYDTSFAAA